MLMFPRAYVVIIDEQNKLIDFKLYENNQDGSRAYHSWRPRDGGHEWRPSRIERISYKRLDLRIAIGFLPFETFHSVSDDEMRAAAGGSLYFDVMAAAKKYERRSLLDSAHLRSYYRKKYRYLLSALLPIIVVTVIILFLRRHYLFDPLPNLSILISVVGFSIVAYILNKEFGSWIGAILGAAAAWVVWGLLLAILAVGSPLFGW